MYRLYHTKYSDEETNDILFFDDALHGYKEYSVVDPDLRLEVGKAGSLSFKLPISNIEYDNFEDLVSYVDLYRNDELLFSGRVFGVGPKDFYGKTTVNCEGLLAVFNDSIFEPITFNGTLSELLQNFLDQHNAQVDAYKFVHLGNVTVEDEYVYRKYENYEPTINRLDDIVESYGGYLSVRKEDGVLYLDYLEDFTEISEQTIDFGNNLLDLTQETDVSELATVLIPFGASEETEDGTSKRIDITSVNLGVNYIENAEGISRYGRIVATHTWDDVTVPSILKTKATAYLADICAPKVSIEVNAVDMAKAGSSINFFKPGMYIPIRSEFHGINRNILVKSQSLKLLDPTSNTMTLSDLFVGFVGKTNKNVTNINNNINYVNSKTENNSVKSENLQKQINVINEAGFINADGAAGIFSQQIATYDENIKEYYSAVLEAINGQIQVLIDANNNLKKYFTFGSDGLIIQSTDETGNVSDIYSVQDEDSYKYKNQSGETLFEINTSGVKADTYDTQKQVSFSEGDNLQWAIRHGEVQNGKFNLNDVWIGG